MALTDDEQKELLTRLRHTDDTLGQIWVGNGTGAHWPVYDLFQNQFTAVGNAVAALKAQVSALPATSGGTPDPNVAAIKATVERIENALKGA